MVPFLLQMGWYNQRSASDNHIVIDHPDTADPRSFSNSTEFHSVMWDDVQEAEGRSRLARLRLAGRREEEDIFALFEVDMRYHNGTITLSPVPFGLDGRPRLPYKDDVLGDFLFKAAVVLSKPGWSSKELAQRMRSAWQDYTSEKAWFFLCQMRNLGFSHAPTTARGRLDFSELKLADRRTRMNGVFETAMTAGKFKEVFGLSLPVIPSS